MKKGHRKALLLVVKCAVALGLLAWVFGKVHLDDETITVDGQQRVRPGLLSIAQDLNWWLLGVAAAGFAISLLVISIRWWMLLRIQRIRIRLWEAVRLTFLGHFFNAVVPGVVGGDLVKAYYVSRHTPKKGAVVLSVFVDRVMGLTELALMAAVMIVLVLLGGVEQFGRIRLAAVCMLVVLVVVAAILALLLSRSLRRKLRLQKLYQRLPLAHHIAAAGDAAVLYRRRLKWLLRAILITFGAHVAWIGSIGLIGASLSLAVPWYSYLLYVPLIYIIGAVPLTPGGVGIVENFYLIFLASPVVGESQVFALSVLARVIPMIWGLPGAVVGVTGPKLPKMEAMQAELGLESGGRPGGPDVGVT